MNRYYDETTLVHFGDLRNLIKEEFGKFIEAVNAKEISKQQQEKPLSIQQLADR
jgi:hypothetical protein